MFPDEFYEQIANPQDSVMARIEYEEYLEQCQKALNAAKIHISKYNALERLETVEQAFERGFVIGWLNDKG